MSSELFQSCQAVSEIQLNMNIKISRILHGKSWEVYFRFFATGPSYAPINVKPAGGGGGGGGRA